MSSSRRSHHLGANEGGYASTFISRSKCFNLGGFVSIVTRSSIQAKRYLLNNYPFEAVTEQLRFVVDAVVSIRAVAPPESIAPLNQFIEYVDNLIRLILGAEDVTEDRQALALHIDEILKSAQRMGEKMRGLCD